MKHRFVGIPPLSGLTTAQEQKLSSTQLNNLLPPRARHWPYGKVIGHGAAFKNSQKICADKYLFESPDHSDSPQSISIHARYGVFAGVTD